MEKVYPKPLPVIHAMLICDKIITDADNKKKSLIGIFDTIYYEQLPLYLPELWIYINLADVFAQFDIKLELIYLKDSYKILEIKRTLKPTQKTNWEIAFFLTGVVFKKEGIYAFRFWMDEDIIGEKYIYVRRAE